MVTWAAPLGALAAVPVFVWIGMSGLSIAILTARLVARKRAATRKRPRAWGPKAQIEAIAAIDFAPRTLWDASELYWLSILEAVAEVAGQGHRVQSQVGATALLRPSDAAEATDQRRAMAALRSKRIDFVIVDDKGRPKAALLLHGRRRSGLGWRDDLRRKALLSANIPIIDISQHDTDETVAAALLDALNASAPLAAE